MNEKDRSEMAATAQRIGANIDAVRRQYSGTPNNAPVEARCKAQFESSVALREEFGTLERYTGYIRATESGLAKVHQPDIGMAHAGHAPRGDSYGREARCKAQFESSVALREEFGTLERYTGYVRATERGLAKVHQPVSA
jgi:hypothetical protein